MSRTLPNPPIQYPRQQQPTVTNPLLKNQQTRILLPPERAPQPQKTPIAAAQRAPTAGVRGTLKSETPVSASPVVRLSPQLAAQLNLRGTASALPQKHPPAPGVAKPSAKKIIPATAVVEEADDDIGDVGRTEIIERLSRIPPPKIPQTTDEEEEYVIKAGSEEVRNMLKKTPKARPIANVPNEEEKDLHEGAEEIINRLKRVPNRALDPLSQYDARLLDQILDDDAEERPRPRR
jgi:hypothetical protein